MSYTKEALVKYNRQLSEKMKSYSLIPVDEIRISISTGNRKIGRVMNVSLPAIMTCGSACKVCLHDCYDIKACLQYPASVLDARARNLTILKKSREEYFGRIADKCARRKKNKFFRWHVSGDILDIDYLDNMVKIARQFPDFKFWTYTKQYFIVNKYVREHGNDKAVAIPSNLSIMFSDWKGLEMLNPYGFGTFGVILPDMSDEEKAERSKTFQCPGNCDICKDLNRGCIVNETTNNKLH